MSDYILTYSKIKFYPMDPVINDINIKDIAHALSLMTRANGHFKHFYSVGQHSINCYREAKERGYSKRIQLGCLLHDASESYISDLTRPVKQNLSKYFEIEERVQGLIYQKFGIGDLSKEEMDNIKDVDDALLYYEFKALMGEEIFDDKPYIAMEHDFEIEIIDSIEKVYLRYAESHPEVCFAILNSKGNFPEPIYENKKTQEGMSKRLELLSKYYYRRDDISEYILV